MFVSLEFAGSTGHAGVLLTGLGPEESCFLHLTGTSYPRKKFAVTGSDSPSTLTTDLTGRVLIPSREDGNEFGVSEGQALDYWRYYKTKTFNHPQWGEIWKDPTRGREDAFNSKYSNYNHNCSLFANRLLIAASLNQGIDTNLALKITFSNILATSIKNPGWFLDRSRKVRDQVLTTLIVDRKKLPIYGLKYENLHRHEFRIRYSWYDNLRGRTTEELPKHLQREAEDDGALVENEHHEADGKFKKQVHKWKRDPAADAAKDVPPPKSAPPSALKEGRENLLAQLNELFGEVGGL